jgi:hypothetical protein
MRHASPSCRMPGGDSRWTSTGGPTTSGGTGHSGRSNRSVPPTTSRRSRRPLFRERSDGRAPSDQGRGAQFGGGLPRDRMTRDRTVDSPGTAGCAAGGPVGDISDFLQPYSASRYIVEDLTMDGIIEVVYALTGQARHPKPPRGGARAYRRRSRGRGCPRRDLPPCTTRGSPTSTTAGSTCS